MLNRSIFRLHRPHHDSKPRNATWMMTDTLNIMSNKCEKVNGHDYWTNWFGMHRIDPSIHSMFAHFAHMMRIYTRKRATPKQRTQRRKERKTNRNLKRALCSRSAFSFEIYPREKEWARKWDEFKSKVAKNFQAVKLIQANLSSFSTCSAVCDAHLQQ